MDAVGLDHFSTTELEISTIAAQEIVICLEPNHRPLLREDLKLQFDTVDGRNPANHRDV